MAMQPRENKLEKYRTLLQQNKVSRYYAFDAILHGDTVAIREIRKYKKQHNISSSRKAACKALDIDMKNTTADEKSLFSKLLEKLT